MKNVMELLYGIKFTENVDYPILDSPTIHVADATPSLKGVQIGTCMIVMNAEGNLAFASKYFNEKDNIDESYDLEPTVTKDSEVEGFVRTKHIETVTG